MSDSQKREPFTSTLWGMDEKALIQTYIVGRQKGDDQTALAILQAKATLAAEEAAKQSKRVATATFWLAAATFVMAVATVVLALKG